MIIITAHQPTTTKRGLTAKLHSRSSAPNSSPRRRSRGRTGRNEIAIPGDMIRPSGTAGEDMDPQNLLLLNYIPCHQRRTVRMPKSQMLKIIACEFAVLLSSARKDPRPRTLQLVQPASQNTRHLLRFPVNLSLHAPS